MELPDAPLPAVQDTVSTALERQAGAFQRLGQTVQEGLTQVGQEVIRSQTTDAHIALAQRANDLDSEIRTKKAFMPAELRQRLGDAYGQLPDEVRKAGEAQVPVVDPQTGKQLLDQAGNPVTQDRGIPTFAVAHALYGVEIQKAIDDASQHITTGPGWQGAFRRAALGDAVQRWNRVQSEQLAAWHQDQADTVSRQVLTLANSGDFKTANARIESALPILGDDGQMKLRAHVASLEQVKPVYDAMLHWRTDPSSPKNIQDVRDAAARVDDQAQMSMVDPMHRAALARQLHAILKQVDESGTKNTAAGLAVQISLSPDAADGAHPDRLDPAKAFDVLDGYFKPGGKYASSPELRVEAGTALQKLITERNQRAKYGYDQVAGGAIDQFMGYDAQGVPHMSLGNVDAPTRAALQATGKDGEELLHQFTVWERAEEAHNRQMRQLPSDPETARAFLIERSMATNPGAWRALSGVDQMKVMQGKLQVPGEPAAPMVAISSRDVPNLSKRIAEISAAVKPKYTTDPAKVAFEEAEAAFPSIKRFAGAPEKIPRGDARDAVNLLRDKIASYIDAEVNRTGNGPTQEEIRKEARRLMQTVEVKDRFFGYAWPDRITRLEAEEQGKAYRVPDEGAADPGTAPAAAPPAIPPPPAGTPEGWIPYRNAKTGELRYNKPGLKHPDWNEAR